jgi:hypothetical protein
VAVDERGVRCRCSAGRAGAHAVGGARNCARTRDRPLSRRGIDGSAGLPHCCPSPRPDTCRLCGGPPVRS